MRRSVLSAVFAAGLSLVACSDQPTEAGPGAIAPPLAVTTSTCSEPVTPSDITGRIDQLFPSGPLRTSAQSRFKSIPDKTTKTTGTSARDKAFLLIDFILQNYYAGNLIDGTSLDKVLQLITALHCYVGLTPPAFPTTTSGSDIVVRVLFPNVAFDFSTPEGRAGLRGGAGAVTTAMGGVIVTISDLPDQPPPLRTSLDQYPRFYLFHGTTATGAAVVFNEDVIAATCLRAGFFFGSTGNLRLAHNVGPNFGDVEVLPSSAVLPTGVTCPDEPDEIGSTGGGVEGRFTWAKRLFLPNELHAASVVVEETKVGGTTRKFSEFGIVDQTSNPARLSIVDADGNPTSGSVTGPGTVYVKAASRNGTEIQHVPVDFDGTEVPTNEDGIAAFNWTTATPGATLTVTVANEVPPESNEGQGCLGAIPEHQPEDPYRPFVCFTPSSVVFSAVVAFGFESGEPAWTPTGFWSSSTLKGPTGAPLTNTASPALVTTVGDALPTPFAGSFSAWYGQELTGNYIGTQAGNNLGGTSTEPNFGSLVSPLFTVPDVPGIELRFRTWWEIESVNPTTFDLMQVRLNAGGAPGAGTLLRQLNPTTDPGTSSSALPYTSAGFNTAPAWKEIAVDLSAYRGQTAHLRFVFSTGDILYNGFRGWIVDEVLVLDATGLAPPVLLKLSPVQGSASTIDPNTVPARTWRP